MYLITDSEEDERTVTAKEINLLSEVKVVIFDITEDENLAVQTFDAGEQK